MSIAPTAWAAGRQVHWTLMGQNAVTFDWEGPDSTIRYGTTVAYGRTAVAVPPSPAPFSSSGPFWEARLTGLLEDKTYHYSIGGGPDHTFRTPPPRGSSAEFTIFVEGDIGDVASYPDVASVQGQIAAGHPAFVLMVGDLAYGDENGLAAVDNHFNDMMEWSQEAAYMPAWGNHEADMNSTDDLRNYKGRFDLPNAQASPGSPPVACCGEDWYWFDYGNVRFIAYPEPFVGAWPDWNARADSLMDAAQADPAIRFIVTFGHRAAYSSGHHAGLGMLKGFLDALGAEHSKYVLNLNAHSHNYERTYHQGGVVHVTAGAGGSPLGQDGSCLWLTCQQPAWSAFRAMHLGPVKLRFSPAGIQGTFVCASSGGGTTDIECALGNAGDSFLITESRADASPVVAAPATSAMAGSPVSVVVTASDPNGQAIASLTADLSSLPPGNDATFTANAANTSGTLSWTPGAAEARPAPYNVPFTATNALAGSAAAAITVTAGQPPSAALTVAPGTGNAPLNVTANASASSDPDGDIVSYRFDFGDGTVVGPQPGPSATHVYAAGSWPVSVLVADGAGGSGTATGSVFAGSPDPGTNLVGNPSFEVSISGWAATSGSVIQRVSGGFDGSFSALITGPATGTAKFGLNDAPNAVASVASSGTVYRMAAWVRSASYVGKAEIRVREYVAGVQQGTSSFSPTVTVSPLWKRVEMDYVTLASGSTLDMNILYAPVAPGEWFQADNISIVEGYVISAVAGEGASAPRAVVMVPNPVHPTSALVFHTSRGGPARVTLYDLAGRRVRTLVDGALPAGRHAVRIDGGNAGQRRLPSGVYFYRVETREQNARGKFVVLR